MKQDSTDNSGKRPAKKALVIGGGIAGLTAAWELARLGLEVELAEKSPFLGGHGIQFCCKAAEECLKCGACSVEKRLSEVIREPRIKVRLRSELRGVEHNGAHAYVLCRRPLYIDPGKCTNCAICFQKCPAPGAIVRGCSRNQVPFYAIDERHCLYFRDGSCSLCRELCPEKAINLDLQPGDVSGEADAIVLATGFQAFDPVGRPGYGYGINKNVITALELERMLRQEAGALRPSDGREPENIAFIQCVGSRDHKMGRGFCSQVCCAYAIRMAEAVRHRHPRTSVTIFYMDIQNCGKDFARFYERSKAHIRFVRYMPGHIFQVDQDRLAVCCGDEASGKAVRELFDMVVLSVGIMPGPDNTSLAELLHLDVDQYGFLTSGALSDTGASGRGGVFLAGTVQGPKDIADSMAEAGQAARRVARYLGVMDDRGE